MADKPKVWITKRKYPSGKRAYVVRWVNPVTGKCGSRSLGPDKKLASNYAGKKRRELADGIIDDVRHVTWSEFSAEHVASRTGKGHRKSIEATLRRFGETCNVGAPHHVTYSTVESYVNRRRGQVSGTTINRELRELRCAFNEGIRRGHLRKNPTGTPRDGIRFEPTDEPIPVVLTDDEKRRLLAACPSPTWRTFLYLLMTTGCRRGEVLGLTWDRVHLNDGYLCLTRTKAKKDRLQPLVVDAVVRLRELLAGVPKVVEDGQARPKEPCVFRSLWWNTNREFNRIRTTASLPHALIKSLRSTAGTDTVNSGFDVSQAGDFLGHTDYNVTRRHYVVRQLESKRLVAESLAARLRIA